MFRDRQWSSHLTFSYRTTAILYHTYPVNYPHQTKNNLDGVLNTRHSLTRTGPRWMTPSVTQFLFRIIDTQFSFSTFIYFIDASVTPEINR